MINSKRPKRPIRASLVRPVLARTGGCRRLDLIIIALILVFGTTKNSSPEAVFLLVLILVLGLDLGGILGCSGILALAGDRTPTAYIRRRRGRSRLGFNAKNSLKNVAMGGLLTGLGGLGTIDKSGGVVVWAGRSGDLVGSLVQGQFNHALGWSERFCI